MDICIVLIDVWSLGSDVKANSRLWDAYTMTRYKIADLLHIANANKVPVFAANASKPYPSWPVDLSVELNESSLVLQDSAFSFDGWTREPVFDRNSAVWPIVNTVDFHDYKTLVYAGYKADYSVGTVKHCGYRNVKGDYEKYIVKDATLCRHFSREGLTWWPKWSQVEPTGDYIEDTFKFCDEYQSLCKSITVMDFKDMVC